MTEKALEAVRLIKFTPAEINWHTASQKMRFEFNFNDIGSDEIAAKDAAGRIIESVAIIGYRRITEIRALIQTEPGDLCCDQMTKDLAKILATGYFYKAGTRVFAEEGMRGRVAIVFKVQELDLISEVKFEGLKGVAESVILEVLRKEEIDLREGRVYDPAKVGTAISVIRKVLESNGQRDADVSVRTENVTATSVVLTFVITAK